MAVTGGQVLPGAWPTPRLHAVVVVTGPAGACGRSWGTSRRPAARPGWAL